MLRVIAAIAEFLMLIFGFIFNKRSKLKSAEETLPEKSPTAEAVEAADAQADEKFGPKS